MRLEVSWRPKRWARGVAFAIALAAPCLGMPERASAADKEDIVRCVKASDEGQVLRDDGKLLESREAFRTCSQDVCPAIVKKDCTEWLAAVEARLASFVPVATSADGDVVEPIEVFVDGKPAKSQGGGAAIDVEPGRHTFRFEAPDRKPVEIRAVIREGERERRISVVFPRLAGVPGAPPPDAPPDEEPTPGKPFPVAAAIAGGVGVIGMASFAYFGIAGKGELDDLRSGCGQTGTCSQDAVDSARSKLLIADISLGVGIVGLAAGAYFLITHLSEPVPQARQSSHRAGTPELTAGGLRLHF